MLLLLAAALLGAAASLRWQAPRSSQSSQSLQVRLTLLRAEAGGGSSTKGVGFAGGNLMDKFMERFTGVRAGKKANEDDGSEDDRMLSYLKQEPWRADKIKNLPIVYRSTKDSWQERYFDPADDTIYLYGIPGFRPLPERTRAEDLWVWPWMWSKVKADRLSWLHKIFYADCSAMTVQEHMEMDALLSEFDMPVRWGLVRMKELDVLNVFFLNLCVFTDFTAIKPTDLGLRPDGTVKTCPVQFHNCISSSNNPGDEDHYAPPFRWSRDKSPDQAYDEIKNVYMNYPKRGLKWTNGWIDRGGWHPQQFSGPYFYAEAESLAFHFAEDIELVLDVDKRQVQYRSSNRIGAVDWDVERLRYNQFCRMLDKFGGWYTEPLDRLRWLQRTPYHWTEIMVDKTIRTVGSGLDYVVSGVPGAVSGGGESAGAASRALDQLTSYVYPYVEPALEAVAKAGGDLLLEPRVAAAVHVLQEWRDKVEAMVAVTEQEAQAYVDKVIQLLPERLQNFPATLTPSPSTEEVEMEKVNSMDLPLRLPENHQSAALGENEAALVMPAEAEVDVDGTSAASRTAIIDPAQTKPWRAAAPSQSPSLRSSQPQPQAPTNPIEDVLMRLDARSSTRTSAASKPADLSEREIKVLKARLDEVRKILNPPVKNLGW